MTVVDTDLGRVGALCYWEHIQPLSKYAMYSRTSRSISHRVSFSVYEGGAAAEVNTAASRIYAVEGQCFVLATCATVSDAMVEFLCDTPTKQQLLKKGEAATNLRAGRVADGKSRSR